MVNTPTPLGDQAHTSCRDLQAILRCDEAVLADPPPRVGLDAARIDEDLPRVAQLAHRLRVHRKLRRQLERILLHELRLRRAVGRGAWEEAAAIEEGTSRRGELLRALRRAVEEQRYGEAASLAQELQVEDARRMDVTQDEGAYSRDLDQDDWYAQGLAAERQRLLDADRRKMEEREEERRRRDGKK